MPNICSDNASEFKEYIFGMRFLKRCSDVMERAQLLVESPSRPALQGFLKRWLTHLRHEKAPTGSRVSWSLEVDPVDI